MKNIFALILAVVLIFVSCSEQDQPANTQVELSVTGMVCEMGCGTSLKKGLMAAGIDEKIDLEFNEETGLGNVIIRFNDKKTNIEDILKSIEGINDGQFSAEVVKTESIKVSKKITNDEDDTDFSSSLIEAKPSWVTLPNLSELFKYILP